MFLIVWCLTLLPGIFGDPTEVFRGKHRIVNGTAAPPGSFPYMISLQFDGVHFCGGTILNDKWILTAAHCVDGMIANSLSVVAGTVDLKSGGVTVGVIRYVPHVSYDPANNYENDIAVVELESALPLETNTNIAKVKLPKQGQVTEANKMATVIGWGFLYTGGPASDKLMMVNVRTYSDEDCSRLLAGNNHPATDMCAGIPEGLHCGGDSGGPLIVEGLQVGIVSWSVEPCALPPYPGVYTEVSQFKKWIKNTTSNSY